MTRLLIVLALLFAGSAVQAAGIKPAPNKQITTTAANNGAYKVLDFRNGDCSGCVVDGVTWNVDRTGVDARGWDYFTLKNSTITLRAPTSKGDFPSAISITATTKPGGRYFILNNTFRDFIMVARPLTKPLGKLVKDDGKYMQGEPVNCDDRKAQVELIGNKAFGSGDAGYDLKCTMVKMDGNYAEGANYGYRIWGVVSAGTNTSHNARVAHNWFSQAARVSQAQAVASGETGAPVFYVSAPGAVIDYQTCKFNFSVPTKVLAGPASAIKGSKITLGPSCRPDANGYAVNTDLVGVCSFDKALRDKNDDGIIELGIINRAICGQRKVKLIGQSRSGKSVYEKAA